MTFEQFYKDVIQKSGIIATMEYVKILWVNAYTIEQAIYNLQTMDEL